MLRNCYIFLSDENLCFLSWSCWTKDAQFGDRFANPKHTVNKLSGLHALQISHYKGDNIINVRRLIRRVVLAEVKKNYFLAANLSK